MTRRFGIFLVAGIFVFGSQLSRAQSCDAGKGEKVLTIELQSPPNNMEPKAEPTRVRTDDRSVVSICLVNVSPLDVCSLSGRTPTPTTETNPIESLVTTISGLGGIALGTGAASQYLAQVSPGLEAESHRIGARTEQERQQHPQPLLDDPEYKWFNDLGMQFNQSAQNTVQEQLASQKVLDADTKTLVSYLSADYRGRNWTQFRDPEQDSQLKIVRSHFTDPQPSFTDAASSQAAFDQMASLASDLHKKYDKNADPETVKTFRQIDTTVATDKAVQSIIGDNNTALKAAQSSLRTSYLAIVKVYNDFQTRRDQKIVITSTAGVLVQKFRLGTDRKATVTGVVSCVSAADSTKATTDQINYSILYQDVPRLTASAGFLTTFLEKKVIGTSSVADTTSAGFHSIFAVTDSARAQIFPMAYVNWRFLPYWSTHWHRNSEDELIVTTSFSGGFGVNPNTGTNQPEFFIGESFGFNRLMIHPGVHFGRTQALGGGFSLNSTVPPGFTGPVPITWSYHPAFSIGFSVRVAPF